MVLQIIKYKLILDIQPILRYKSRLFMSTAQYKTKRGKVKEQHSVSLIAWKKHNSLGRRELPQKWIVVHEKEVLAIQHQAWNSFVRWPESQTTHTVKKHGSPCCPHSDSSPITVTSWSYYRHYCHSPRLSPGSIIIPSVNSQASQSALDEGRPALSLMLREHALGPLVDQIRDIFP